MGKQEDEEESIHLLNPCEENTKKKKTKESIKALLPDELRTYWKVVILATVLLLAGFTFLGIAVYIVTLPSNQGDGPHSYVFFLCAFICIIPGGYHVVYIYNACVGKEGYHFEALPKY